MYGVSALFRKRASLNCHLGIISLCRTRRSTARSVCSRAATSSCWATDTRATCGAARPPSVQSVKARRCALLLYFTPRLERITALPNPLSESQKLMYSLLSTALSQSHSEERSAATSLAALLCSCTRSWRAAAHSHTLRRALQVSTVRRFHSRPSRIEMEFRSMRSSHGTILYKTYT